MSDVCVAQWIRRLPSVPFSSGSNRDGNCFFFFNLLFFSKFAFFFFNLLFFLICVFLIFFFSFTDFFFLIYLKGLYHEFLFLHKSRSPRTPLITLRVNLFFHCFISSMFPPFIVSGRTCMTISRSTLALARSAKNII